MSPDDTSQRLAELTPLILDRWEERVRRDLPGSRHQDAPLLRDHLPVVLLEIAQALSPASPDGQAAMIEVSQQHGNERAWQSDYSLDQVLREYSLLRSVVIDALESDGHS